MALQHTVDLWRKSTQGHSQDKNKKRAHKGQQDQSSECFGCLQDEDNTEYILIQCVYARQAWYNVFEALNIEAQCPSNADQLSPLWPFERRNMGKPKCKDFHSIVML
jgi:hypothetical protein